MALSIATVGAAASVAAGPVADSGALSSTIAADDVAVVVSGSVLAEDGSPRTAATVVLAVLVDDPRTGAQRSVTVDATSTEATGSYTLRATPAEFRAVGARSGPVAMEVRAETDELYVYDFVADLEPTGSSASGFGRDRGGAARPEATSVSFQDGLGALSPGGAGGDGSSRRLGHRSSTGVATRAAELGGSAIAPADATDVDVARDYEEPTIATPPAPAGTGPETDPTLTKAPDCDSLIWWPTDQWKRGYVPVSTLKTEYDSKQSYTWETTRSTEIGVAITGAYGKYAGGLTTSTVQQSGTGVTMNINDEHKTRTLKVEWAFRKLHAICVHAPAYPGDPDAGQHFIKKYKWDPHHWTGGNIKPETYVGWACDLSHKVIMQNATYVMRSSTTTWDGWLSVAGVEIGNSQAGSDKSTTVVDPRAGRRAEICGYHGDPIEAEAIKELV